MSSRFVAGLLLAVSLGGGASRLDDALWLESKGKLKESMEQLRVAILELRSAGDQRGLARAWSASGRVAVALGEYRAAIQDTATAIALRKQLKTDAGLSDDFNTLGLADLQLGKYDESVSNYQEALQLDRARHDMEGEIIRENNIGNVCFFRGKYLEALGWYRQAWDQVNAAGEEPWRTYRRQWTITNLAALYQKIGKEQTALDLYRQLAGKAQALPRAEYAQLLLNEGVLYRKLGDPVKALQQYRAAQALFAAEHRASGEILAMRDMGIVRTMDLDDPEGALEAFGSALALARQSSDTLGMVQAALYRGEVYRRMKRLGEAERDFRVALEGAQNAGLSDATWKAEYGLGRVAEDTGHTDTASECYRRAAATIETLRSRLGTAGLKSDFLADKREVYDSLIALSLARPTPPVERVFSWVELSRARSLEDRSRPSFSGPPAMRDVQAHLPPDTALLDFWVGGKQTAALWITGSAAGIVPLDLAPDQIPEAVRELEQAVQGSGDGWRELSRCLGIRLLHGLPESRHWIVVPDGPLGVLPFELLTDPASGKLLIETRDVSYLPAARFLLPRGITPRRLWRPPWRTELIAFGAPTASGTDALAAGGHWQDLPATRREIEGIARVLSGRAEIHLGPEAHKRELFSKNVRNASLLHFSTHALLDSENPDRSRILMAGDSPSAPFDYLFQREIYDMDLSGVDLVTVSACDTARGSLVRGDGIQSFSHAFLAAGAVATVTSLWKVADQPTAEFMQQFYYFLARGEPKSEALRSAKLACLRSGSGWSAPRYWAAFVLNGDGWHPCARVIPWSDLLGFAAAALLAIPLSVRARYRVKIRAARSPR